MTWTGPSRLLKSVLTNVRQTASVEHATRVTLDNLFATMDAGDVKTINLIIKGDVQGSVETLQATVTGQNTDEVKVRVIHAAVGGITESDVELADASKAVIIGFNVIPDTSARVMAEQRRVEIRQYDVIYQIFDDLKKALSGMLEPEVREKLHGHAEVRKVFKHSKVGSICGCYVTDGHIQRGSKIRLTAAASSSPKTCLSRRSSGSKTTSRKSRPAWSAALSWPATTTSRKAIFWRHILRRRFRERCRRGSEL